ncbi:winged helix-turn-helix domain-containing protein [Plantactinospora siamensis]|uniref:Winged helix-turn-helix domain-containing protein n=1 Tax=Plantactinospora siamensis TaxID=555372 RepID=A0ABV6P207_9ACTN
MSIAAIPPHPFFTRDLVPPHRRPGVDSVAPAGGSPRLRLTVDLAVPPGPLTPATARLLELVAELAGAGASVRTGTPDPPPAPAGPVDVGIPPAGPVDAGLPGAGPVGVGVPPAGPVDVGPPPTGPVDAGLPGAGPVAAAPVEPWPGSVVPGPRGESDGRAVAPSVGLWLRKPSREVWLAGRRLSLTRLEYDLLAFLAQRPRRVFTRAQLLTLVWGYEPARTRTVDVHVRRLRAKFDGIPVVTTVNRVGYRLAAELDVRIEAEDAYQG